MELIPKLPHQQSESVAYYALASIKWVLHATVLSFYMLIKQIRLFVHLQSGRP